MTRLRIDTVAGGGDAIGHVDGKVVFVPGAVPGDVVDVEIVTDKPRYARARLLSVLEASPVRIDMPCPHAERCGGCTWQMVPREVQLGWKEEAVRAAIERIARLPDVPVRPIDAPGPAFGYRNRLDLHPGPAGPGFYEQGSRRLVSISVCLLPAPPVADLLEQVLAQPADGDLTLRAGLGTGESVIVGRGHTPPRSARIAEEVDGFLFQISGMAFFQPNTDGAEALVGFVREAVEDAAEGLFVDAYAGVGLFAVTVGGPFPEVIAIESDPFAARDLAKNAGGAHVIAGTAEEGLAALDRSPGVVVVDPPRVGLGTETVQALLALSPDVIVSVSCDPATFARDARDLVAGGYDLEWVQPVDQFPQTPHVETVARFVR